MSEFSARRAGKRRNGAKENSFSETNTTIAKDRRRLEVVRPMARCRRPKTLKGTWIKIRDEPEPSQGSVGGDCSPRQLGNRQAHTIAAYISTIRRANIHPVQAAALEGGFKRRHCDSTDPLPSDSGARRSEALHDRTRTPTSNLGSEGAGQFGERRQTSSLGPQFDLQARHVGRY